MTRLKFSVLLGSSVLASLLILLQIYVEQRVQASSRLLAVAQQTIEQGQQSYSIYRQLAARTYQASQQEPGLKDVLIRQNIVVTPSTAASEGGSSVAKAPASRPN